MQIALTQAQKERWKTGREILALWTGQHVFFALVTVLVQYAVHPKYMNGPVTPQSLLTPWTAWDAGAYADIATNGYRQLGATPYAPLYPFLEHVLAPLFGHNVSIAGLVVASAAELCALLLLRQLVQEEVGDTAGQRAVFFLVWAPFSVYLAAAYAESLFLLLSIGVFWMLHRGDRLGAGVLVALAVLTRPQGILLLIPLVVTYQRSWRYWVGLAAPVAAFGGYWGYMSLRFLTPLAPIASERANYDRTVDWPWSGVLQTLGVFTRPDTFFVYQHAIVDLALVSVALLLAVQLVRLRLPRRYAVYTWVSMLSILCWPIAHPGGIDSLASAPRYLFVLFPLYIPLVQWSLRSRTAHRSIALLEAIAMGYVTVFFAAGIWVG